MNSFKQGDKVVYPKHGLGVIEKIDKMSLNEEDFLAFHILFKAAGLKITLPTEQAIAMGLRTLSNEKTIEQAFSILQKIPSTDELDSSKTWKDRKKILQDLFATGTLENLAYIVKYLYDKNQHFILPNSERHIYDFSLKFLIYEIAEVKNISEEEAEDIIAKSLN